MVRAQPAVGLFYEQGRGVEQNLGEAVRWYLVELHEKNATAAYGAALGYCWHGPGRPVVARKYINPSSVLPRGA